MNEPGASDVDAGASANAEMTAMLKIWGRPTSICTQRVLWAAVEAAQRFEFILASATMGEQGHVTTGATPFGEVDTPEYRRMNPNATIPTIDDDGFVLWESNAIVTYLATRYAPEQLYGADTRRLALACQWMAWANERLEPPLHVLVMELTRLPDTARTPGAAQAAVADITPWLELLDEHLARQPFVAGDDFSMGDIPTGAAVYRFKLSALGGPPTPHLDRWLDSLAAREGFARHVAPRQYHF